jgi:hypothetical protein
MVLFYIMENETNKNYCPAQEAFKVLANKWSLMIIKELSSKKNEI